MSRIEEIIEQRWKGLSIIGFGLMHKNLSEEIAKQVAKEIFKNLEKKRDKLWSHKCKYGLRERVEFLKDDYDEVKKEWLGDEE